MKEDKKPKIDWDSEEEKQQLLESLVNDAEMRHGHKTSSRNSDGYKAEIITGGEKASIIIAVEVDGANTED